MSRIFFQRITIDDLRSVSVAVEQMHAGHVRLGIGLGPLGVEAVLTTEQAEEVRAALAVATNVTESP